MSFKFCLFLFLKQGGFNAVVFFSNHLPVWFLTRVLLKWLLGKLTFTSRWFCICILFWSSRISILAVPAQKLGIFSSNVSLSPFFVDGVICLTQVSPRFPSKKAHFQINFSAWDFEIILLLYYSESSEDFFFYSYKYRWLFHFFLKFYYFVSFWCLH